MTQIINCHTHVFTSRNVPSDFVPIVGPILMKFGWTRAAARLLNRIIPFRKNDVFDRYASLLRFGDLKTQAKVFEALRRFYPQDTRFVLLSMDMERMGAGRVQQPFLWQLKDLARLKRLNPDHAYPFVFAHPARPHMLDIVKRCIEKFGFTGIKLYPPLGYYPFDEGLHPIYDYAQKHKIPVLTHCSGGPVYYRGPFTPEMRARLLTGRPLTDLWRGFWRGNQMKTLADPDNYKPVLRDFPELMLCLAHFGGADEWDNFLTKPWNPDEPEKKSWFSKILDWLREGKYPNLYTDVAYTPFQPQYYPLLKLVLQHPRARERVLFGSDFYMLARDASERAFGVGLRGYLGETDFIQIAQTNPRRFLSL